MNKYLGFISMDNTNGLNLSDFVGLPHYGGVVLDYEGQVEAMYEFADDMSNPGDYGYIAVTFDAEKQDLIDGKIRSKLNPLECSFGLEEVVQRYCEVTCGFMSLRTPYVGNVLPAQMWPGALDTSHSVTKYVTAIKEWNMDMSNILSNLSSPQDYMLITDNPREVIERRGIDMLGPLWVLHSSASIGDNMEVLRSKINQNYYLYGETAISAEVVRMHGDKIRIC